MICVQLPLRVTSVSNTFSIRSLQFLFHLVRREDEPRPHVLVSMFKYARDEGTYTCVKN